MKMALPAVLGAAALGITTLLATAQAQAQQTVKVIGFLSPKSMSAARCMDPWLDVVRANMGRGMKFEIYWGGTLGRNPSQQYDLIVNGVADMGYMLPGYRPGQFPDDSVFELPYLVHSSEEASVALWRMYKMDLLHGYQDSHVVGFFAIDPYVLHLKEPITSLDDLEGVKIRTAGPVFSDFIKAIGGVPVAMPVTQMVEGLQRGIVQGATLGWSGTRVFRLDRVTKFHFEGPFGAAPVAVVMNKKAWQTMPKSGRDAIDQYGGEFIGQLCGRAFDLDVKNGVALVKKAGNTVRHATEAEVAQGLTRFKGVHEAWIERTADGRKKYDAAVKILADIRAEKMAGR